MSNEEDDYLVAMRLHQVLNGEKSSIDETSDDEIIEFTPLSPSKKPMKFNQNRTNDYLNSTQNLVHPDWETIDPTPDVQSLFVQFDDKFFQKRLQCVTLEWSKRMYSCAGICYSRKNRFGMDVTIRLSEPLLKLRPRKDLVETMLHEMIHAYCFVLNIREGNGGHGPNFKKIMHAINKVAGTNITVYHTFHDEVEVYRQHVWRCNGICQNRSPFFGYIKRTTNRTPGPNDRWWQQHQQSCGGCFKKIEGPETKPNKKPKEKIKTDVGGGGGDLRKYFTPKTNNSPIDLTNIAKINGHDKPKVGTKISQPNLNPIAKAFPPTSYPGLSTDPFMNNNSSNFKVPAIKAGGNLSNVRGFRDLSDNTDATKKAAADETQFGRGYSLDTVKASPTSTNSNSNNVDREHLRNLWSQKFNKTDNKTDNKTVNDVVKQKTDDKATPSTNVEAKQATQNHNEKDTWIAVDNELEYCVTSPEIIQLSSDDDDDVVDVKPNIPRQHTNRHLTADQRQINIKREILDDTDDLIDDDIVLIDDEYDDSIATAVELADTSLIDEFFGEDTLLKDFKLENDVIPCTSSYRHQPSNDIITCPICQGKMKRCEFAEHLDGCTGITKRIEPNFKDLKKLSAFAKEARKPYRASGYHRKTRKDVLLAAGYSRTELANLDVSASSSSSDNSSVAQSLESPPSKSTQPRKKATLDQYWDDPRNQKKHRQRSIYSTRRQCPLCAEWIEEDEMNEHLTECPVVNKKKRTKK